MALDKAPDGVEQLLETSDLAVALESHSFKQFLDRIPVAVAVSELHPTEKVVYANPEFERLCGRSLATVLNRGWQSLPGVAAQLETHSLGEAITQGSDHLGAFNIPQHAGAVIVDAWSNLIEDEAGHPTFRLVALVATPSRGALIVDELEDRVREKDIQLQELQHRVKNNLQMITALIRIEARGITDRSTGEGFDRLAGRIEALGLLYRALSASPGEGVLDLGIYLSEIASAVMRAHAMEGIHLDLQVDTWLASLNVAMPAGLVVNELLTNALKHAFKGRGGGTITLRSTTDAEGGCRVLVADDGVGLPEGYAWPKPGKLSALIVRSLLQNATARIDVKSAAGQGMQVEIHFRRVDAAN
jgi:two-component sensor histidine kinase